MIYFSKKGLFEKINVIIKYLNIENWVLNVKKDL